MQNRAAVLYDVHDLRINEVPVPEPGPRQVLVEVKAVGVCGSDVHYEHGRVGPYVVREPLILGHESGGVVGRGPGATRHQVGQRVALEPGVPCGACRQCRAGRYNLCPEVASSPPHRSTAPSATTWPSTRTSPSRSRHAQR
jgi:L-iditol 2-dehydrogenase